MPPVSRRQFVQTSLAGSLAGAVATWAPHCTNASSFGTAPRAAQASAPSCGAAARGTGLHAAVFDERFDEAVRFGQAARERGLTIRGLRGDVTDLWYRELHPLWKERRAALAGLTAYAALFCLEQLAWDHRMRVVYRAAHRVLADGGIEHLVSAPEKIGMRAALQRTRDWPQQLASMIARIESRRAWSGLPAAQRALELPYGAREPVLTLHSWVIAEPARG